MAHYFRLLNIARSVGRRTRWADVENSILFRRVSLSINDVNKNEASFSPQSVCTSTSLNSTRGSPPSYKLEHSTNSESRRSKIPTSKVLYDGDCKICQIEISALKKWTKNRDNIEFIDISQPDYDPKLWGGVSYEDAMKEMHVVGPDGKVYTEGDAVRHMYRACGLGFLSTLTELPLIRSVCDELYVHFAKYRLKKALDRCDSNSCDVRLKHLRDKLEKENKTI